MSDLFDFITKGSVLLDGSRYQGEAITEHVLPMPGDYEKILAAVKAAKEAGAAGMWFRATEGRTRADGKMYVDPWYALFARASEELGFPFGAYHRYVSGPRLVAQAVIQAYHFLSETYSVGKPIPPLPPMLDWENLGAEPNLHPYDALTYQELVRVVSRANPIMYTSANYLDGHTTIVPSLGANHEWALAYRMVVASYPFTRTASSLPSRPRCLRLANRQPEAWQYSGTGTWPGFRKVDLSEKWV